MYKQTKYTEQQHLRDAVTEKHFKKPTLST